MNKTTETFSISQPENWRSGLIFASPHSGRTYPEWFLKESRLSGHKLRSSEDAYLDHMIAPASEMGAVCLSAHVPRSLIDLNRDPKDMDPVLIRDIPLRPISQRAQAGLGVIPRIVARGLAIHNRKLERDEALRRVENYWRPYHVALDGLMREARRRFGRAILIDMHSMPHESLSYLPAPHPQVVMGTRHGKSISAALAGQIEKQIQSRGWRVKRNIPFAGAYILSHYGRPTAGYHAIQLEFDRSLYMDEATLAPLDNYHKFKTHISDLIRDIVDAIDVKDEGPQIAAE